MAQFRLSHGLAHCVMVFKSFNELNILLTIGWRSFWDLALSKANQRHFECS